MAYLPDDFDRWSRRDRYDLGDCSCLPTVVGNRESDRPISTVRVRRAYDLSRRRGIRRSIEIPEVLNNRAVVSRARCVEGARV